MPGVPASCSHQVTIMLIARSTEPDAADLQYAYLCPEPDRAVQESLLDGQLRKASWMTSGEDHSEPAGVFANPRPVVRTITGEEFMQLLPTGTNSTLRSRGSSVDSGVRHILSDSSLTGVGAMLPLASSDSTSQSITTGGRKSCASFLVATSYRLVCVCLHNFQIQAQIT